MDASGEGSLLMQRVANATVQDLISVQEVVADHASATMTGTLLGYVLLYAFLLVSYIGAMRHMATKPAASQALGPVTFTTQPSAQH